MLSDLIFLLHAGPIYRSRNQGKLPFLPIFNVFKYILCCMDMALLVLRMRYSWLDYGAISGIFLLPAGPIYSSENQVKLLFLTTFNVFQYNSSPMAMPGIEFQISDDR